MKNFKKMKFRYISTFFDGPLKVQRKKSRSGSKFHLILIFIDYFYSLLSNYIIVKISCYLKFSLIMVKY